VCGHISWCRRPGAIEQRQDARTQHRDARPSPGFDGDFDLRRRKHLVADVESNRPEPPETDALRPEPEFQHEGVASGAA
jgi:hypothetical protein